MALLPAAACASAQAKAKVPVEPAALEVPPVPPRVIEPLPSAELPLPPVENLPTAEAPPPVRTRPQSRERGTEPPKPEAKPAETPAEPAATPAPAGSPVPPLRTPGAADGPEAERQVRDIIGRANKILETVDYGALSQDRRANYDGAKNFIKQAEENLKISNWVLAKSLAERAESLAKLLAGR